MLRYNTFTLWSKNLILKQNKAKRNASKAKNWFHNFTLCRSTYSLKRKDVTKLLYFLYEHAKIIQKESRFALFSLPNEIYILNEKVIVLTGLCAVIMPLYSNRKTAIFMDKYVACLVVFMSFQVFFLWLEFVCWPIECWWHSNHPGYLSPGVKYLYCIALTGN
jgi:hypothetical protein